MLARLYVEALLADEVLTDQVWELWNQSVISDQVAVDAWSAISWDFDPHPFEIPEQFLPKCQ
jgi:hypothetical protein